MFCIILYRSWMAKECTNHLKDAMTASFPVEILRGKKNVEVYNHSNS